MWMVTVTLKSFQSSKARILSMDRLATGYKCMIFILVPYFLLRWSIPTPFLNSQLFYIYTYHENILSIQLCTYAHGCQCVVDLLFAFISSTIN